MALPFGNGPVPYASSRGSPVSQHNMDTILYVEGHGEWRTQRHASSAVASCLDTVVVRRGFAIFLGIGPGNDKAAIYQGGAFVKASPHG